MGLHLIADLAPTAWLHGAWVIFEVAFALGLVIFVHELGHFLVAKLCGVKCEKFYIGFDAFEIRLGPLVIPRALWKKQLGETEYGVGILPLGGYVKMLGQDDNPRNAEAEAERIRVAKIEKKTPAPGESAAGADRSGCESDADGDADESEYELDPRSYPAKSVPQRMAIISAGVIMNLIFAVLFAAIAFRVGVQYVPCEIGSLTPGDPAWAAGLQPGDQVLQVGRRGKPSEYLRFGADLSIQVVLNGADRPLDLLVRRRTGQTEWFSLRPTSRLKAMGQRAAIGVRPAESNQLDSTKPVCRHLAAGKAQPPFQGGDKIVAVDGQTVHDGNDLHAILAQRLSAPLTFTVERPGSEAGESGPKKNARVDIRVPPSRRRCLGLVMQMGPIVAVRRGSPAERAGFRADDLIQTVNGQPAGDPLALPQRVAAMAEREIPVEVLRNGQTVTLRVSPEPPKMYAPLYGPGSPVAVESLGVAYRVDNVVAAVQEQSPAAAAGVRPGDEIFAVQLAARRDHFDQQPEFVRESLNRKIALSAEAADWPRVYSLLQWALPDTEVQLWRRRDGRNMPPVRLKMVESDQWFWPGRGLVLLAKTRPRQASTWTEALALGCKETKERFVEVLRVLGQLLTFRMSFTGLAGPVGLVNMSVKVAEAGIVTLLLFLTFISVNLAILNFLPIPALDGGHMVFLAAEAVRGEPVDEALQIRLTILGIGLLLTLMLVVTVLDISRIFF